MKRLVLLAAMIAMWVTPVDARSIVLVSDLLGSNAVPPSPTSMAGIAVVILDVQIDGLFVRSAKAAMEVYLTGLTPGTAIIEADVDKGLPGTNGPTRIDSGISRANPVVASGPTVLFSRANLLVTSTDATAIMDGPSHFYVDVQTANAVVRGQLRFVDPFQFALPFPGLVASLYTNQATYVTGERFVARVAVGNFDVPRQADIFEGLIRTAAESAALCPTANDRALQFRGPGGATSVECQSNLGKPGNRAIPLATNVTLPVQGLQVITIADEPMTQPPGQRGIFICAATPGTVQNGIAALVRCATASFTVLPF